MEMCAKSGWPVSGQRQVNSSVVKTISKGRPGRGLVKVSRRFVGRVTTYFGSLSGREALGAGFFLVGMSHLQGVGDGCVRNRIGHARFLEAAQAEQAGIAAAAGFGLALVAGPG